MLKRKKGRDAISGNYNRIHHGIAGAFDYDQGSGNAFSEADAANAQEPQPIAGGKKRSKKIWKRTLYLFAALLTLLTILIVYIVVVSDISSPGLKKESSLQLQRKEVSKGFYTLKDNWFRKSKSGLYELYVEGDPSER